MDNKTIQELTEWIKNYVAYAGAKCVVIGMSGGKDSLIAAKLCANAIGEKNVYGLIMPNGEMSDFSDAEASCKLLNINYNIINIKDYYNPLLDNIKNIVPNNKLCDITTINTAPRLRMTTLYALAGSINGLVVNTSNLSETMVGYTTKWGDNVGDFAPLKAFTKTEVCEIGLQLGLPNSLVYKTPSDGLSNKSDEDKLGFSYNELDEYIRNGTKSKNFEIILQKHKASRHKRDEISKYNYNQVNHFDK